MAIPSNIGISLWLEPNPSSVINTSLQNTISSLRPLFDDAPRFRPHLTVTSQIDIDPNSRTQIDAVLNGAKAAASAVDSIDVLFAAVAYGSKYTKKVFIRAERSPKLLSLAQICREEFVILPQLLRNKRKRSSSTTTSAVTSPTTEQKDGVPVPEQEKPDAASEPISSESESSNTNIPQQQPPPTPDSSRSRHSTSSSKKSISSIPPAQLQPSLQQPKPEDLAPRILPSSPEYHEAAKQAAQEAAEWLKAEFDPHVSLVYSSRYPIDEALQQTVKSRLSDLFGEEFIERRIGFRGTRLSLVLCEGPVESWRVLGHRDF